MRFIVQPDRTWPQAAGPRAAILVPDSGDDHGYRTSYDLWFRRVEYVEPMQIGRVKIALVDQEPGPSPLMPGEFSDGLPRNLGEWISLGQEDRYYETIAVLGSQVADEILGGLGDIVYGLAGQTPREPSLDVLSRSSQVVANSLMRSVSPQTIAHQFWRISTGGPRLARYKFEYRFPTSVPLSTVRPPLEFEVQPYSAPPSNIHVFIGRNGVGKTTLLRSLAAAAVRPLDLPESTGKITYLAKVGFANVLLVTFSAFDPFAGISPSHTTTRYTHVGLTMHLSGGETEGIQAVRLKGREDLADEFCDSLGSLATSGRYDRWVGAVDTLASDPQFEAAVIGATGEALPGSQDKRAIEVLLGPVHDESGEVVRELSTGAGRPWRDIFMSLSSGHAIVLLTITRLVDLVAEQTLVLIDEPEAHLHPPLLSSFVRALSDLLTERNGVAITATHSPVVLQEVPKSCVYKISRNGSRGRARRPRIETYGENVGVLTHEIFGLEVMKSGFYAEVGKAVSEFDTYEEILDYFAGQLGDEAKGLVRILLADKRAGGR
ncbi:AAA family ATPase [Streptomyces sp. NRRL F-2747]|uniref:AAA family ATPase n=1 Tax=Streptomyces sp. NRRL F-2747 TaxID=1463843 RepID=UPI000691114F|nr:AAA family ATPase [Streptomyces sp. NRRL F-2747]